MTRLRIGLVASLAALVVAGIAWAGVNRNFSVHQSGDFEVPAVATNAQGQAIFKLSKDGESLGYKLIVANIDGVFMAHIHMGEPEVIGPIVVWLYPSTAPVPGPPTGRIQGPIATGTITADNLVGPLEGAELSDLLELLESGNAYVNVHTLPDHPGGEIRGNF
jgi:CHRD domain